MLRVKSEIFGFDLASSVQTATRASHDLYVVVLALSALDVSDDIWSGFNRIAPLLVVVDGSDVCFVSLMILLASFLSVSI